MDAIQRLCSRCFLLDSGHLVAEDTPGVVVARYLGSNTEKAPPNKWIDVSNVPRSGGTGDARFVAVQYNGFSQSLSFQPYTRGPLEVLLVIESRSGLSVGSLAVSIRDQSGMLLVNVDTDSLGQVIDLRGGRNTVRLKIERLYLNPGRFIVGLWLDKTGKGSRKDALDYIESAFEIEVIRSSDESLGMEEGGPVACEFQISDVQ
jgi:hypothetical protein